MISGIKLLGERNTGTNYLRRLIELNFNLKLLRGTVPDPLTRTEFLRDLYFRITYRRNLGWKHAIAPTSHVISKYHASTCQFITLSKNPYSWLLSMCRRPYHNSSKTKMSFDEFLTNPWRTVGREQHPQPFATPMEMWNKKNQSYVDLGKYSNAINLRYEDLLSNPEDVVSQIADRFGLTLIGPEFINLTESTKERTAHTSGFEFYQDYYLNERWRKKLSGSQISIINKHIDAELMCKLGYQKLGKNVKQ